MDLQSKYGQHACVAGAGEGLGRAFSLRLAEKGFSLLLIDLKDDLLAGVKAECQEQGAKDVFTLNVDLASSNAAEMVRNKMVDLKARFLVYNASYGPVKQFLANSGEELERYINVNAQTPTKLIHLLLRDYSTERLGVLLISSLAGWRGTQLVTPYAATKAYTWNLAEGLHYEYADRNLDISVCVPGAINTPNFNSTEPANFWLAPKPMEPDGVAQYAINRFGQKLFLIPGFANRFSLFLMNRLLPRSWGSGLHNYVMGRLYTEKKIDN